MKTLSAIPPQATLDALLEPLYRESPVKSPEIAEDNDRRIEIKRFIRSLRKNREIRYTRDFMYWSDR